MGDKSPGVLAGDRAVKPVRLFLYKVCASVDTFPDRKTGEGSKFTHMRGQDTGKTGRSFSQEGDSFLLSCQDPDRVRIQYQPAQTAVRPGAVPEHLFQKTDCGFVGPHSRAGGSDVRPCQGR